MALIGLRLDSKKTASWSAIPGTMWTWLTRVSLLVKNNSSMLELVSVTLVGSVTTCSKNEALAMFSAVDTVHHGQDRA